ncbi:MAG TPA: protein-disulfide reductase DsbD family protein, partial [Phycisphaerales bacterium]|nr:protein-disulfide reductase DsbD family protein [Phycisphaerales bacterium]
GWHMYWNGRNDSGLAPTVTWTLPEGWAVKQTRWPAPVRYTSDILLDHVYHDRVVLLATVSIPAEMANPGVHRIKADARWMVCQEACVIERGSAEASIMVESEHERTLRDKPPPEHPLLLAAEEAMPRPVSEAGNRGHEITPKTDPQGATQSPRALGFRVAGAVKLEFYPDRDCAELADLIGEGSVASDTITLTLSRQPSSDTQGTVAPAPRLKGVLAIWPVGEVSPVYYQVE